MKTSRVPSKTRSSAATKKAPKLGAKAQTQAPAYPITAIDPSFPGLKTFP